MATEVRSLPAAESCQSMNHSRVNGTQGNATGAFQFEWWATCLVPQAPLDNRLGTGDASSARHGRIASRRTTRWQSCSSCTDDFPTAVLDNVWTRYRHGQLHGRRKFYVVQTQPRLLSDVFL